MNGIIRKWGNSLAIRIPGPLAKDVRVHEGSVVEVSVVKDSLVVKPLRRTYSLRKMLDGITEKNRHPEQDWGGPVGREVW